LNKLERLPLEYFDPDESFNVAYLTFTFISDSFEPSSQADNYFKYQIIIYKRKLNFKKVLKDWPHISAQL
jgi:hypothetical protein